jgi:hypothetical protein
MMHPTFLPTKEAGMLLSLENLLHPPQKERSDDFLIDNQLVAEKLFVVEIYGTLFFTKTTKRDEAKVTK